MCVCSDTHQHGESGKCHFTPQKKASLLLLVVRSRDGPFLTWCEMNSTAATSPPTLVRLSLPSCSYLTRGVEWVIRCLDRWPVNRGDVLDNLCKWQGHASALISAEALCLSAAALLSFVCHPSAGFQCFQAFLLCQVERHVWVMCVREPLITQRPPTPK